MGLRSRNAQRRLIFCVVGATGRFPLHMLLLILPRYTSYIEFRLPAQSPNQEPRKLPRAKPPGRRLWDGTQKMRPEIASTCYVGQPHVATSFLLPTSTQDTCRSILIGLAPPPVAADAPRACACPYSPTHMTHTSLLAPPGAL